MMVFWGGNIQSLILFLKCREDVLACLRRGENRCGIFCQSVPTVEAGAPFSTELYKFFVEGNGDDGGNCRYKS